MSEAHHGCTHTGVTLVDRLPILIPEGSRMNEQQMEEGRMRSTGGLGGGGGRGGGDKPL